MLQSLRKPALALSLVLAILVSGCSGQVPKAIATHDYTQVPQVIGIIGDFGVGNRHEGSVAHMVNGFKPDLLMSVGDNVYSNKGYQRLVGEYYKQPMIAATGNHDYQNGIANFDSFFNESENTRTFIYQADSGVDFFVIDSQAGLDSKAVLVEQKAWLIRSTSESTAKFKVVLFHHPSYSSGKHGSTKQYQWDFASMGVDLVVNGHDHIYERIQRAGLTFVVDGTGGAGLYKCRPTRVYGSKICLDSYFGALFLYANASQLRGVYRTSAGDTLDTFTINK